MFFFKHTLSQDHNKTDYVPLYYICYEKKKKLVADVADWLELLCVILNYFLLQKICEDCCHSSKKKKIHFNKKKSVNFLYHTNHTCQNTKIKKQKSCASLFWNIHNKKKTACETFNTHKKKKNHFQKDRQKDSFYYLIYFVSFCETLPMIKNYSFLCYERKSCKDVKNFSESAKIKRKIAICYFTLV
ncbi:hypothetical protein RFI_04078 [Reticulomyxa filosa]|uniref:Uncharacterized protein n=1 Tax=Reticulomyxa filosa TaxID=46433 RepID=X6P3B4_RETFI|nr:hypothetical protein RFI_04078 [Reticulomyxa filosa]|eukprot:ETO33030.1 hypothetical protein RFI_04078 [Reticulomyxa filosa]